MLNALRRVHGILNAAGLVVSAFVRVMVVFPQCKPPARRRQIAAWSCKVLNLFGLRLVATGVAASQPASAKLYVANHVSWLDIIAIWATTDTVFVAKAEVGRWPVIGGLARRLGMIFVDRSKRSDAFAAGKAVADVLKEGGSVCLFPEGTSTEGRELQPFHSALFQAAVLTGTTVQPLAIRYFRADGNRATKAAFTGDMSLVGSIWRLADAEPIIIDLSFLAPLDAAGQDRRTLSLRAHELVGWRLRDPLAMPTMSSDADGATDIGMTPTQLRDAVLPPLR